MALEKDLQFAGLLVSAAYTRVAYVGIDVDAKRIVVQLKSYASKAARDAGVAPFRDESLTIQNEPERSHLDDKGAKVIDAPASPRYDLAMAAQATGDTRAALYGALKALPEFAGAKDA